MDNENGSIVSHENQQCLTSFKIHWAKAQIDGPMQTVARYDDVAKLLITIGGFLLAVLAGGYSAMVKDLRGSINVTQTKTISLIVFVSMLIFFISAAAVCFPQPKRMAMRILELNGDEDLTKCVKVWCDDIGRIIKIKRILLGLATGFFIISFLVMILLLLNLL